MDSRQKLLLSRTLRSYITLSARARQKVTDTVAARWDSMESWRDADMVGYVNTVVPIVLAGERVAADLTNTYLSSMSSIATGRATPARPIDYSAVTGAALRDGVDPDVVYKRPQATMNYALSKGSTVTQAVKEGRARAVSLASTDMQLARTHAVAEQGRGTWWRRVLTGSENCALCVIASTQRYRRGSLSPIHPGCDCAQQEEESMDPGQVIEPDLLEALHTQVVNLTGESSDRGARVIDGHGKAIELRDGSTRAADYTDLIVVSAHGEYGPTLRWRGDAFTGPEAIN